MSFTEYCRTRGITGNSVKKHVQEYKQFIEQKRIETIQEHIMASQQNVERHEEVDTIKIKKWWEFWK